MFTAMRKLTFLTQVGTIKNKNI